MGKGVYEPEPGVGKGQPGHAASHEHGVQGIQIVPVSDDPPGVGGQKPNRFECQGIRHGRSLPGQESFDSVDEGIAARRGSNA
jgi:hypothetical protein